MPNRSILLRVLFVSLALAAVFGAIGVLFASYEMIWRVSGTSIATAGAALLLLGASVRMDKPASRPACLLGATLIVGEYLLTLASIWDLGRSGYGPHGEGILLTLLFVALVGIPAIAFMRMATTTWMSLAGRVGLGAAAVEMVLLLVLAWSESHWTNDLQIGEISAFLPPFAMLAVLCLIGHGAEPRRRWRWVGVAAAAAGFLLAAYGTIRNLHQGSEVVVCIICVAALTAHANIVILCQLRPGQMWLRWVTLSAGAVTALLIMIASFLDPDGEGTMARLFGATSIIAGCGTLALMILALLNRRYVPPPMAMTGVSEISLICPVCHKNQSLSLGSAQCTGCHVLIHIRVEEPRCTTCGYSLLMLNSPNCPECGTPVPAARPATASPPVPPAAPSTGGAEAAEASA